MTGFTMRNHRIQTDFKLKVRLRENRTGKIIDGELTAIVVNLSKNGANIRISKLFLNRTHLFFSTLQRHTHTLILEPAQPLLDKLRFDAGFKIDAQSVWMDKATDGSTFPFIIGVEFMDNQKVFFSAMQQQ
ncbi:hypothetical protein [Desulforhopalus singaporensis]|uniref:PilZ domain-containing protein n=1 Tax=Desulforhopalus singaporensis TaxID=91360 RepID=A0A1H0TYC2_9BACT|nr:hypothetical protein [Desulforhopalus singaporensis]SDP58760.1 hypothetical protein SAMN05660330_03285 [Desulforhopalus singaporensis]